MDRKLKLEIVPDESAENPLIGTDYTVVSFLDRRDGPQEAGFNRDGSPTVGLRRKLKVGTAFMLKCYRHGCEVWSLMSEEPGRFYHHAAWDTSRNCGVLLYTGKPKWAGNGYEERRKRAQAMIDEYSTWVNGGMVGWVLKDENDNTVESCWGYSDSEYAEEEGRSIAKGMGDEVLPA